MFSTFDIVTDYIRYFRTYIKDQFWRSALGVSILFRLKFHLVIQYAFKILFYT